MNTPAPQTLIDASMQECATALSVSFDRLSKAAQNAQDLLRLAGIAGAKGDTADDLINALAIHGHMLHQFEVKIRTHTSTDVCTVTAHTKQGAYAAAAERQGDEPFGITVMSASQIDLAAAHRALKIAGPLSDALSHPALSIAVHSFARKHRRPAPSTDFKRNAANDRD
ncbi:hypothetical protein GTP38_23215 [Duganella sp. FT94W]|uniref:Uncharacterized protein n=1 Tax=Duganella lactea TaxID=2692173 RepID=A0ABW9VEW5_9BURK|nr:hypothetical protein [Duganella lactea]MYM37240.1 hypothetical protein [Duganella lactea]